MNYAEFDDDDDDYGFYGDDDDPLFNLGSKKSLESLDDYDEDDLDYDEDE